MTYDFAGPDAFNFFVAVYILVGFMVGGIVSIPGAIFSGLFIVLCRIVPKILGWAGIRIMTAALGDLRRVPDAYHLFCILWREGSRRTVNSMDEKKSLSLL